MSVVYYVCRVEQTEMQNLPTGSKFQKRKVYLAVDDSTGDKRPHPDDETVLQFEAEDELSRHFVVGAKFELRAL